MSKAPAFQFYVQDFLSGVRRFTAEETGAYLLLLCEQWDIGFIENSPEVLKKITGLSPKKLEKVLKKFELTNAGLVNKRMEAERQKQAENREKQRNNALKRYTKPSATAKPPQDSGIIQNNALQFSSSSSNNGGGIFVPPTTAEIKSFFKENGYREDVALKAYDYYSAANWIDGNGNTIKNWKQKMISVWFTDDHKISNPSHPQSFMKKL